VGLGWERFVPTETELCVIRRNKEYFKAGPSWVKNVTTAAGETFPGNELPVPVVCRTGVSVMTSKLQRDTSYEQWCKDHNFDERSSYTVAPVRSKDAVIRQLSEYNNVERFGPIVQRYGDVVENILYSYLVSTVGTFNFCTEEEAWQGYTDSDSGANLDKLPLDTSPGYALNKLAKTKEELVQRYPMMVSSLLSEDWNSLYDVPVLWPFTSSEKDERLPTEKVATNLKLRLFQGGPLAYTFTGRRLLGKFAAQFYARARMLNFAAAIGMDVFRGGWHRWLSYLTDGFKRQQFNDADVGRWDKNYARYFHVMNAILLMRLCAEKDAWLIYVHMMRIMNSPAVLKAFGWVFMRTRDEPSGNILTVIENSLTLLRIFLYIYCMNTTPEHWTWEGFWYHMRVVVLGDDSLSVPSKEWNLGKEVYIQTFNQFGWKFEYNHESELTTIEDFAFAGRGTKWNPIARQYWPVLPRGRVLAINEWRKGHHDPIKSLERAWAMVILAFPYMFDYDPIFVVAFEYYMSRIALINKHGLVRVAGTLADVYELYSGYEIYDILLEELYRKNVEHFLEQYGPKRSC